jgi:hypothetical protein
MPSPAAIERFDAKVEKTDGCWIWRGALNHGGYGVFTPTRGAKQWRVHRLAYTLAVGPIPDGYEIDHLCFTRACVRPSHLEVVTALENTRRKVAQKTHCAQGHPWTPDNPADMEQTYRYLRGRIVSQSVTAWAVRATLRRMRAANVQQTELFPAA